MMNDKDTLEPFWPDGGLMAKPEGRQLARLLNLQRRGLITIGEVTHDNQPHLEIDLTALGCRLLEKGSGAPPRDIPVDGVQLQRPRPAYVKLRCPVCQSANLKLVELWESTITWVVTDGWMDRANGNLEPSGPTKVEASCTKCSHHWTPRKAKQIDALAEEVS
jgi:hypothetical protein